MYKLMPELRAANAIRQAEWDPGDQVDIMWRVNELGGEIGEVCNVLKKLHREALAIRGSRATPQDLANELADGVICCDLVAMHLKHPALVPRKNEFSHDPKAPALTYLGVRLLSEIGNLASVIYSNDATEAAVQYHLEMIVGMLLVIAEHQDIDLKTAVIWKFNETSTKNNLRTRMPELTVA